MTDSEGQRGPVGPQYCHYSTLDSSEIGDCRTFRTKRRVGIVQISAESIVERSRRRAESDVNDRPLDPILACGYVQLFAEMRGVLAR